MNHANVFEQLKDYLKAANIVCRHPVATRNAIEMTEQQLGLLIPPLLSRCYLEIGNGGFGPGLGVIGIDDGEQGDFGNLTETYRTAVKDAGYDGGVWPRLLLPFCSWGCATLSCVVCDTDEQVFICEEGKLRPQNYSLDEFFSLWMEGVDLLSYDGSRTEVEITFKNPFTQKTVTTKISKRNK